jgi:hypothetical protein
VVLQYCVNIVRSLVIVYNSVLYYVNLYGQLLWNEYVMIYVDLGVRAVTPYDIVDGYRLGECTFTIFRMELEIIFSTKTFVTTKNTTQVYGYKTIDTLQRILLCNK